MACGCRGSGSGAANQQGSTQQPRGPSAPGYTWNGPRRRKTGDTGLSSQPTPPRRPA